MLTHGGRCTDMWKNKIPSVERSRTNVLSTSIAPSFAFSSTSRRRGRLRMRSSWGQPQFFTLPNSGAWTEGPDAFNSGCRTFTASQLRLLYFSPAIVGGVRILANSLTLRCADSQDSALVDLNLTGRTDVRVRLTRDLTAQLFTAEVWNGDGGGRASGSVSINGSPFTTTATGYLLSNFGVPSGGGELAFFSTLLNPGSN